MHPMGRFEGKAGSDYRLVAQRLFLRGDWRQILLFAMALLLALSVFTPRAQAVPASPHPIHATQPDGTAIVLYIRGSERFHWQEDANGYTVLRSRGRYVYAHRNSVGRLAPTDWEVGKVNPKAKGLRKRILPSRQVIDALRAEGPGAVATTTAPEAVPPSGTIKNLVVMVRFADHVDRPLPTAADMDVLFNADLPDETLAPTGSVKMVYGENSYGEMSLESTISGWVTVSGTEAYYANNNSGLTSRTWEALQEALEILDDTINFNDFDADGDGYIDSITFIHSGYGAEWGGTDAYGAYYTNRIWSHRWAIQPAWVSEEGVRVFDYHISPGLWGLSGANIGRIGVIAHETGHFFGLPDLYDTDGDGNGIGSYGLMANSWGFDGSQLYPPHFSAWSKIQLGWLTPIDLWQPGSYTLSAVETSPMVYKVTANFPDNEYLLIENRQPIGFDGDMPQGGLAVWHIDDEADYNIQGYPGQGGWPGNGEHYRVALLQADGQYELEKNVNRGDRHDVYHAGSVSSIGPDSIPNTDAYQDGIVYSTGHHLSAISAAGETMTFSFNIDLIPTEPPQAPSDLVVTSTSNDRVDLAWTDNADNEEGFEVERKLADADANAWVLVYSPAVDAVSYSDLGLASGTSYDYRVRAYNLAGFSGYSNVVTVTTEMVPQPPAAPTDLSAAAVSTTQINLTWVDNADNEDGFKLYREGNGEAWAIIATLAPNVMNYADTGLAGGTSYTYQVVAFNTDGSADSNTVTTSTDSESLPDDTTASSEESVSGTVTGSYLDTQQSAGEEVIAEILTDVRRRNQVSFLEHVWRFDSVKGGVSVTFNADCYHEGSRDAESIDFFYKTASDFVYLFTAKTTDDATYQSRELPADTTGTVFIKAVDSDRSRGSRGIDRLHVRHMFIHSASEVVLTAPTNVAASSISTTEIGLTWTDATGETSYRIDRQDGGGWLEQGSVASGVESYTAAGLLADTTYTFRVCSVGADSTEACSDPVSETTMAGGGGDVVLTAPTNVAASSISTTEIGLTWTDATGEISYRIDRQGGGGWLEQGSVGSGAESYTAAGLLADTTYTFRVCSVGADSTEACSDPVSATTMPEGGGVIELSAVGHKVRRTLAKADLVWTGANGDWVYILRNGELLGGLTDNDGMYTDNIRIKSKGVVSYEYQVCEEDMDNCSNIATVVF